jgi:PAS domain S-box-containing protein
MAMNDEINNNPRPQSSKTPSPGPEQMRSEPEEKKDQAELFKIITKNMLDMVALTDMEGNFLFAGKSHEILGCGPGFLIGKNVMDFVHPEDLPGIMEEFAQFIASGHPRRVEYRNRCKDGTYIWLETLGNFIKDENGVPQKIVFSSRDITARKQTEETAENERAYLSAVIDNIGEAIVICDAEGRITRFNETARRLHGLPEKPIAPDQWARHYDLYQEDGITPLPIEEIPLFRALQGEHVLNAEIVVAPKHGGSYSLVCNGQAIVDETGQISGAVIAMHDITARKQAEKALRESEEKYRELFNNAPIGIFQTDSNGNAYLANHCMAKILGFSSPREAIDYFSDLGTQLYVSKERRNQFIRLIKECGYVENFEYEAKTYAGNNIWLSMNAVAVSSQKDNTFFIEGFATDITDRKKSEKALKESEERFRVLSEASFEGIVIHENGIIIDANKTFTELFGYEYDQILGINVLELATPECRGLIKQNILSDFEGRYEAMGLRKDGSAFPGELRGRKIIYKGRKVRITAVRDLSEQKKAEEELRKSEEQHRILFENANMSIFVTQDGKMKFINPQTEKITGLSKEKLMERPFYDLIHPEDRDMVLDRHKRRISGEDLPNVYTFRTINSAGKVLWVELSTALFNWEDRPATINFLRDITVQKQLESQLYQAQKMESVGRLAGGVAHDFNNMLSIINGYAEMTIDMLDPGDPARKNIREIHSAGMRSAEIVRQLLAFARQQTIRPVNLDLNDTISGMLKMLQRLIGENINLTWHPGNNLWPVKIDPSQVDQIMANLVVNARDAISDVGKLTIETKNVVCDEEFCKVYTNFIPGQYAMLAVSDDGCGMEKEIQENLFEPFFTTKETGKGTGLGLSTIYGIVKQNNGLINVYSEPGTGTTFKIYLPRHKTEKGSDIPANTSSEDMPTGSETILLVEDETPILQMAKTTLEKLGYTVWTAESPKHALELAKKYNGKINLLITDVVMPEMNGHDLALRLAANNPDLKTLYMSGYAADVVSHHGILNEDVLFMQKPFSIRELAKNVRKAIEQK